MTLKQAGDFLQVDQSMVSRMESAVYPARRPNVLALLDLYNVSDQRRREALLRLSEDVWQRGWWEQYGDDVDRTFVDYPWLESRADRICSYDALALPGLMQTRQYAEAVIRRAEGVAVAGELIGRLVDLRMARQRVLDGETPTRVAAVLDESALRRLVGGPRVMRAQLGHLVEVMSRPNVDLRVLPFTLGEHPGVGGAFTLFEMAEPYPDVAHVESLAGGVYVEAPNVDHFRRAYDELHESSLGPEESTELISAIAEGLR